MANRVANAEVIDEFRFDKRTAEEQRQIAIKGGKASGKARKEKKMMKQILRELLEEKGQNGKTYGELATLGLIKGAMKGNAHNYKVILEVLGELFIIHDDVEEQRISKVKELLSKLDEEAKK